VGQTRTTITRTQRAKAADHLMTAGLLLMLFFGFCAQAHLGEIRRLILVIGTLLQSDFADG